MTYELSPVMTPATGERRQGFVGDSLTFSLADREGRPIPDGWRARLRTNLGRAESLCKEIIQAHTRKLPLAGASWHDLPMRPGKDCWTLELPLTEPGYFRAKAYFLDPRGWQHWPAGLDVNISVHPDCYRTANTIYCAFTRMFGTTRTLRSTVDPKLEADLKPLDAQGYAVIPPSGKFRDLIAQLPHILDTLGCRILHLLPVNPSPTTYARFGRFGSPYASLDLTGIDPALVEFDKKATAVDQFRELSYAVHLRGARLFLDIVINHTGWGSILQDNHPEWFLRGPDGTFISPGAWGNTWEDLVELEHRHVALWDDIAHSLLEWCRRGVDGFRCDAGYKVPLAAWQYITARVRQAFPETIFLLEGLGGAWELTETLLVEGGMQWAYSELFQNYSAVQVAGYMDHFLRQVDRTGVLVHYSETHDNDRLAARGRAWSILRNRLCALASVSGGFGFTCGVEWLAPEKINVHSSRGLAWGSPENLIPELARLNHLLAQHPCFFDHAKLARLSPFESPVFVLRRESEEGLDSLLILVNTDTENAQRIRLTAEAFKNWGDERFELLGQALPKSVAVGTGDYEFSLEAGACFCLSPTPEPRGLSGERYRRARAQAAWAHRALGCYLHMGDVPCLPWRELAAQIELDPAEFLAAVSWFADDPMQRKLTDYFALPPGAKPYPRVITWTLSDLRRRLMVPPDHWLLVRDNAPFRATLSFPESNHLQHAISLPVREGHVVFFEPQTNAGDARLVLERFGGGTTKAVSALRFLRTGPRLETADGRPLALAELTQLRDITEQADEVKSEARDLQPLEQPLVLLTNGLGGMARMCVDLGAVKSKYDCVLGANLNPRVPVDRHIFVKRVRVWVNADGFISPLDLSNLHCFEPGPPAVWYFIANAGDGRTVELRLTAAMLPGRNTTVLNFERPLNNVAPEHPLPDACEVRLILRVDIEDRNFHWETKRNGGAEYHFSSNTQALEGAPGFVFTPAADRRLRVYAGDGWYHPGIEWSDNLPHPTEASRGQTASGDAFSPGWFELPIVRGKKIPLVLCADVEDPPVTMVCDLPGTLAKAAANRPQPFPPEDVFGRQLARAARDFVVRRDDGVTVIAGYPWFLDWGRDSLIAARGLLAAGLVEEVRQLLVVFGRFERDGTLPNTIHGDDASNRDTSDAPLWYGVVCEEMAAQLGAEFYGTKVSSDGKTIAQVLTNIARGYRNGTPNGIRADPESGLVWSPSHFTWMDTNYPAGTPREGYPVEIQVLWIRLLRQLQGLCRNSEAANWARLAMQAHASLEYRFWLENRGYFADLLIAKPGQTAAQATVDDALRSNGLFAISLGLFTGEQARRTVLSAAKYLVVPGGLRSLAPLPVSVPLPIYSGSGRLLNLPSEPYWGHYEGDEDTRRKPAYHNGTAWTWTFPVFCEALARAWDFAPEALAAARAYLGSLDRPLQEGCIGQLPEVVDGDFPHTQRGCDAQAWSVTEALRVWKILSTSTSVVSGANAPL